MIQKITEVLNSFKIINNQEKLLRDYELPEFNSAWTNHNRKAIPNNLHLRQRYMGKEFIIAGSGPSISRFKENSRKGKVLISLCGAQETIKGDIYMLDPTPAGWNGLKRLIGAGQDVFMPYGLYHRKFVNELKLFKEINFEWITYNTAPYDDLKWYHKIPPYTQTWHIDKKTEIPCNTGPQSAALAVSLAIIMGASNIYIIGVDGFVDLLKKNKDLYLNKFCNDHYKQHHSQSKESKVKHIQIRELRDMADRYIFSQILSYCQNNNIGLFLVNKDSHLNETLPLAGQNILV